MLRPVALRRRGQLAALISKSMAQAASRAQAAHHKIDPRTLRTLRALLLNLILRGQPRLKDLAQGLWPGKATSVRSLENRLSYCLKASRYQRAILTRAVRDTLWDRLPSREVARFRGLAVVVVDPTPYPKRSRDRPRSMERASGIYLSKGEGRKEGRGARGYQDAWASLVLKNGETFPLARALSQRWGYLRWALDSVCLWAAHSLRRRCILLGDREVGTKGRCEKLARFGIHFCFRIRRDWKVFGERDEGYSLEEWWVKSSPLGEVKLRRLDLDQGRKRSRSRGRKGVLERERGGVEGRRRSGRGGRDLLHRVYVLRAYPSPPSDSEVRIPFPHLQRPREPKAFWFVCALPLVEGGEEGAEVEEIDPLILVTDLPISSLKGAEELLKLYELRWRIETSFQQCKRELGLSRFTVRSLEAIERLLDLVMLAYALLVVMLSSSEGRVLRAEAEGVLRRWSVRRPRGRLTVGKLKEVLVLDCWLNRDAWMTLLQCSGEFL